MNLVAFDPSTRGTGMAFFEDNVLTDVAMWDFGMTTTTQMYGGIARSAYSTWLQHRFVTHKVNRVDHVVCEVPQIYKKSKGDPNDLIAVAMVAGALCAAIPARKIVTCLPKTWKGQVPKQAHHPRIWAALDEQETTVAKKAERQYGAKFHNVLDAIGLGVWYLKKCDDRKAPTTS